MVGVGDLVVEKRHFLTLHLKVEIDLKKVVPDLPDEAPFVAAEKGMVAE